MQWNGLKYFLLKLKDYMMETFCWLARGRGHAHRRPYNSHYGGSGDLKDYP